MSDLKKITSRGYPGMLVFAKIIKNIDYDGVRHEDVYEYYDRLQERSHARSHIRQHFYE